MDTWQGAQLLQEVCPGTMKSRQAVKYARNRYISAHFSAQLIHGFTHSN